MTKLDTFETFSYNREAIDEDFNVLDLLGKAFSTLGEGVIKTIKQKFLAYILEKFGIKEESIMSTMLQQAFDSIPLADWPSIISGDDINLEYFAPVLAASIQGTIERKGFDGIATSIGIEPRGLIYTTLVNSLVGELGKKKIEKAIMVAFSDISKGAKIMDKLPPEDKDAVSSAVKDQISKTSGANVKSDQPDMISNFLSGFTKSS
jgi:hypothetical protein